MTTATENIAAAVAPLLAAGKMTDLTLICEEQEFKVHKTILCSHSRVFKTACEGEFEV